LLLGATNPEYCRGMSAVSDVFGSELDLVDGRSPRGSIAAVAQIVAGALLTVIGLGMIGFVYAMMRERRGRVFSLAVPFVGLIGAVALLGGLALLLTWSGSG
jgi:hypothetical protein